MAKIKKDKNTKSAQVFEGIVTRILLAGVGKWYNYFGKQFGSFL